MVSKTGVFGRTGLLVTWLDKNHKISQIHNRRVCLIEFKKTNNHKTFFFNKLDLVEDYFQDDMFCQVVAQNRFPVTGAEYCPTWPAAGPAAWQEDSFACHLVKMYWY